MSADNTTRKGKIARLPLVIREEICQRMQDGQTAPQILAWLNVLPEVVAAMQRHFGGDLPNEQNLSAWRQGGYLDWCDAQAQADLIRGQAEMAAKIVASSGLQLSDAAAAIAAGHLLSQIELAADPEEREAIIKQIATLRAGDHSLSEGRRKDRKLDLDDRKLDTKRRELALQEEKFRRLLIEKLIDVAKQPEVQAVLTSEKPRAVQMELLHDILFGSNPNNPT